LVDVSGSERRQVTVDAAPFVAGQPQPDREVTYSNPVWSTDGRLLAFQQQIGVPVETGYEYTQSLFVYDLETSETRTLVEGEIVGTIAWKPGEAVVAYGAPIDFDYFQRGAPNSDLARGLQAVDVASGETFELVKPERGFHLINPRWSQDGRYVAFEEVQYIEGRGLFAIYDFESQEYIAWDKAIGNYDWSPDAETLIYDTLNYAPSGSERIYRSDRRGQDEQPLSPDYEPGYAFEPVFSPSGDRIAYQAELGDMPDTHYEIFVMDLAGGEPRSLGAVDQPLYLSWLPDGQNLVLSVGLWDQSNVVLLSADDGSLETLAEGNQPAPQPAEISE
jgi:Tol biopolymer transport system component